MFYIEKISLTHFKNYAGYQVDFHPRINCIIGANGVGKTNLLDAIYYLAFTKSAFNGVDKQLITHDQTHTFVNGYFRKGKDTNFVSCGFEAGKKKKFMLNKKPIDKISSHIGVFPIVLVSPYDTDLIREGSESRRKFFDGILSQLSSEYLEALMQYNHLLKQRNSLLKSYLETGRLAEDVLEIITLQMAPLATLITTRRMSFLEEFTPHFEKNYSQLTSGAEQVKATYISSLEEQEFAEASRASLSKDMRSGRTSVGPHKDEIDFSFNGQSVAKFASQGQQKSFIIALKLAQFDIIREEKGISPILMMDDFFDRIDEHRIACFADMIREKRFGQVFITDSHAQRVQEVMGDSDLKVINIV